MDKSWIPGKTIRHFKNPQQISQHLFCSICHEVFEQPHRMHCGHTFCYVCIEVWCRTSKKCPICKRQLSKRPPEKDLLASNMVGDLIVSCHHKNCGWEGPNSLVKKHQRQCQHKEKRPQCQIYSAAISVQDQQQKYIEID